LRLRRVGGTECGDFWSIKVVRLWVTGAFGMG
jgi:hypothetical protein